METNISCQLVEFGSPQQLESIALRLKILRLPLGLDFDEKDLAAEFEQFHFAALAASQVIGVLILKNYEAHKVKMRQLAIDENWQGKGVGKKLVKFSETWALQNDQSQITLHARLNAVSFYKSMNYVTSGEIFLEVGIPHIKMQKKLI